MALYICTLLIRSYISYEEVSEQTNDKNTENELTNEIQFHFIGILSSLYHTIKYIRYSAYRDTYLLSIWLQLNERWAAPQAQYCIHTKGEWKCAYRIRHTQHTSRRNRLIFDTLRIVFRWYMDMLLASTRNPTFNLKIREFTLYNIRESQHTVIAWLPLGHIKHERREKINMRCYASEWASERPSEWIKMKDKTKTVWLIFCSIELNWHPNGKHNTK